MAEECKGHTGTMLLTFLAGAVVGGGLALLTAPRSGMETRENLKTAGDDARERLNEMIGDAEQKLREPLEEIQETFQEKKKVFLAAVEAGKQAATEEQELQRQAKA